MKKHTKADVDKDNRSYLQTNPKDLREKAKEALAKAKALDVQKMANGKKFVRVDHKTQVLR